MFQMSLPLSIEIAHLLVAYPLPHTYKRIVPKKVTNNKGDEFVFVMRGITGDKGDDFDRDNWEVKDWQYIGDGNIVVGNDDIMKDTHMCICTQPIHNLVQIQYKVTGNTFQVGEDCVGKISATLYSEMVAFKKSKKKRIKQAKQAEEEAKRAEEAREASRVEEARRVEARQQRVEIEKVKQIKRVEWARRKEEFSIEFQRLIGTRQTKLQDEIKLARRLNLQGLDKWKKACEILGYKYVCKGSYEYKRVMEIFKKL